VAKRPVYVKMDKGGLEVGIRIEVRVAEGAEERWHPATVVAYVPAVKRRAEMWMIRRDDADFIQRLDKHLEWRWPE
jgi:hypothetical protein